MRIENITALELGQKMQSGEVAVADAVTSALDAIASQDGRLNAFITVCEREDLLARAAEVQAGIKNGTLTSPLAGVPIAIKDNICTKGLRTTAASKMLHNFTPPYSATAVERLEAAGMIVIGKLNMDEFAMGSSSETSYFGPVKNPWDLKRVPGGSSGGGAAAIAGGEICVALCSDTGGSIRQPASHCGVVGFKPTYGVVSRYGGIGYASSLDQIGPMARDVADIAALMDAMKGKDPLDSTSLDVAETRESYLAGLTGDIKGKRIGLPKECFGDGVDAGVKKRVLEAADILAAQGAVIAEISMPFLDYVIPAYYVIATAEASSNLARFDGVKYGYRAEGAASVESLYRKTRSEGFGAEVIKRILLGTFVLSSGYYDAYYNKALKVRGLIKQQFDALFEAYDAILCPNAPYTAPLVGEETDALQRYLSDIFTASVNLAGLPALSLPCGFDTKGMPVGAQIIGKPLADGAVLNLGYALQQVTDYHKQIPREGAAV
ncbi:MAG: Asp-tRNA(Asn)/Glu-tRNA(Gln) amidotransferase subunit GatA [Oscillospiraceae bacterium]|nr:Asp-tRNA(Asn)/Glu-tRNA(Gln) amidotransferase subunit GatA [Oscillospiraceae bacterium]